MSSQTGFFLVATVEKRIHPQPKQVKVEEEGEEGLIKIPAKMEKAGEKQKLGQMKKEKSSFRYDKKPCFHRC